MLGGILDPDYRGEGGIGLFLYNGSKEDYVWITGDILGCFLALRWLKTCQWEMTTTQSNQDDRRLRPVAFNLSVAHPWG